MNNHLDYILFLTLNYDKASEDLEYKQYGPVVHNLLHAF